VAWCGCWWGDMTGASSHAPVSPKLHRHHVAPEAELADAPILVVVPNHHLQASNAQEHTQCAQMHEQIHTEQHSEGRGFAHEIGTHGETRNARGFHNRRSAGPHLPATTAPPALSPHTFYRGVGLGSAREQAQTNSGAQPASVPCGVGSAACGRRPPAPRCCTGTASPPCRCHRLKSL
jgi:hypothetical protein